MKSLPHHFKTVLRDIPRFNITEFLKIFYTSKPNLNTIYNIRRKNNSNSNLKVLYVLLYFMICILHKRDHIKPYLLILWLIFHKTNKNIHYQGRHFSTF